MRLLFPSVALLTLLISGVRVSSATDSLGRINFITKLPLVVFLFSGECQAANVWVPEDEPPQEPEGTVKDEYAEVSTVFGKPGAKVVYSDVQSSSEQAVPWTSLMQEYELYKKFHANRNRKKEDSSEDSDEEEAEEDEEEDKEEDEVSSEKLPQAFFGQQNSDDDERDFLQREKKVHKKSKKTVEKVKEESEEDISAEASPSYSDIQGLDDMEDAEKKALIDKIFADYQDPDGASGPTPEEEVEEYDDASSDEDQPQSDVKVPAKNNKQNKDEVQDSIGQKKKDKGKKKKKKKKSGGQGWAKPIIIPIPPPKKQEPEQEGWGWKKHDGFLEQLVKGSTWERVLDYYHQKRDESEKEKKGQTGGWGTKGQGQNKEKLLDKLFKGSFWDRAFQTYKQYKTNKPLKPTKEFGWSPEH